MNSLNSPSNALYRDSNFHFRSVHRRFSISLYGRLNEIFEGFDSAINFYRRQRFRSLIHTKPDKVDVESRERILVTSFSTHRNSAHTYDSIFIAMIKITDLFYRFISAPNVVVCRPRIALKLFYVISILYNSNNLYEFLHRAMRQRIALMSPTRKICKFFHELKSFNIYPMQL